MNKEPSKTSCKATACLLFTVLVVMLFIISACSSNADKQKDNPSPTELNNEESGYLSYIHASLTFKGDSLLKNLYAILPDSYSSNNYRIKGYRVFLQGYKLFKERKPDSAETLLREMLPTLGLDSAKDYELLTLYRGISLLLKLRQGANPETFKSLMPALHLVEKYPSRFRWWIYDMAAEVWYWAADTHKARTYALSGYKSITDTGDYAVRGMFMDHLGRIEFSGNNLAVALKYEDSAFYLGQKAGDQKLMAASMSARADLLIRLGDTAKGYALQRQAFEENMKLNRQLIPSEYLNQAQSNFNKGNYHDAIDFGIKASEMATHDKLLVSTAYGIVAESYRSIGRNDSAFHYLNESKNAYNKYKDELQLSKINAMDVRYLKEKEEREKQVLSDKNQAQAVILSQQQWIIIAVAASLVLAIALAINTIRKRKLRSELAGIELQQQLLRSQMDPHFTFSTMSNLNGLIRGNENDKAINYLNHFGRLLRVSLENSSRSFVSLHQEVSALESYLSLQAMRLGSIFEYHIDLYEGFEEDDDIHIPPMLMQPFVENSIYHGIRNIEVRGQIKVVLSKMDELLRCHIEDNGRGIQPKGSSDKPSMSTGITKDRLRILAKKTGKRADLQIIDKGKQGNGTGVLVILDIPYIISKQVRQG